jgi:hypothetical protein
VGDGRVRDWNGPGHPGAYARTSLLQLPLSRIESFRPRVCNLRQGGQVICFELLEFGLQSVLFWKQAETGLPELQQEQAGARPPQVR